MNSELAPSAQGKIKIGRNEVTISKTGNRILYGCGHKGMPILLDGSEFKLKLYWDWAHTRGFGGTKEQCWKCFVKEFNDSAW